MEEKIYYSEKNVRLYLNIGFFAGNCPVNMAYKMYNINFMGIDVESDYLELEK